MGAAVHLPPYRCVQSHGLGPGHGPSRGSRRGESGGPENPGLPERGSQGSSPSTGDEGHTFMASVVICTQL